MKRRIHYVAFALAVIGASGPLSARATCIQQCEATLVHMDCKPVMPTLLPPGAQVVLAGECKDCCSAPGGPVQCTLANPPLAEWKVLGPGSVPVPGKFVTLKMTCGGKSVWEFIPDAPLKPGAYDVVAQSIIIATFTVSSPTGSCATNADCGVCAVCAGGSCKGLGVVECKSDVDCQPGKSCAKDPVDPCKNACVKDAAPDAGAVDTGGDAKPEPDANGGGTDAGQVPDSPGAVDTGSGVDVVKPDAPAKQEVAAADAAGGPEASAATDAQAGGKEVTDSIAGAAKSGSQQEPDKASSGGCSAYRRSAPWAANIAALLAVITLLGFVARARSQARDPAGQRG